MHDASGSGYVVGLRDVQCCLGRSPPNTLVGVGASVSAVPELLQPRSGVRVGPILGEWRGPDPLPSGYVSSAGAAAAMVGRASLLSAAALKALPPPPFRRYPGRAPVLNSLQRKSMCRGASAPPPPPLPQVRIV